MMQNTTGRWAANRQLSPWQELWCEPLAATQHSDGRNGIVCTALAEAWLASRERQCVDIGHGAAPVQGGEVGPSAQPLPPHSCAPTAQTLANRRLSWANRMACAESLKEQALALQKAALDKLQEAQALLQSPPVESDWNDVAQQTNDELLRACTDLAQQVRCEMPVSFGAATQPFSERQHERSDALSTVATTVENDSFCGDDETLTEALQAWQLLPLEPL